MKQGATVALPVSASRHLLSSVVPLSSLCVPVTAALSPSSTTLNERSSLFFSLSLSLSLFLTFPIESESQRERTHVATNRREFFSARRVARFIKLKRKTTLRSRGRHAASLTSLLQFALHAYRRRGHSMSTMSCISSVTQRGREKRR